MLWLDVTIIYAVCQLHVLENILHFLLRFMRLKFGGRLGKVNANLISSTNPPCLNHSIRVWP